MRVLLAVILVAIVSVTYVSAEIPDTDMCYVDPCDQFIGLLIYPDPLPGGAADFTVHVINNNGQPIPNAFVEIVFGTPTNHYFCPDAVLVGTTNVNGEAEFAISGGGCTQDSYAVEIRANGVTIRQYPAVKSPDYSPMGDGHVGLSDFIFFGNKMSAGEPGCTDYYNSGTTDLGSFIVFGEAFGRGCN